MFLTPSKKIFFLLLAVATAALSIFFISCQKEVSSDGIDLGNELPDLTSKINSSVSGFVTDENEVAVAGASIVFGSNSTTTDKFGYFDVKNTSVTQNAAVVTILKPGYFKAVKTYIAQPGKGAFFRIKLLPKTTSGNIDAAAGGTVTLTNGLSVSLPAGAVMNASTNAAYTGSVAVASQWLSPTATDLNSIMPGDLRGLDSGGVMKLLATYGMAAVELTGTSGELLQIAAGKKATLNFPLPAAVAGTAPATIPLWYFDETKGLWNQQGNAVRSGNNYVAEVSHFSYWNCDKPLANSVQFSVTILDANGQPIPYVSVSIKYADGTYTGAHGSPDSSGYLNGVLPANAQLVLEIFTDHNCSGPAYTQSITTTNSNLSLGNITIGASSTAILSGNVTDCNNVPVTNGYVIFQYGHLSLRAAVKPDGTFSISTIICSSNFNIDVIAIDNATLQQGNTLVYQLVIGINNLGTLSACGTSVEEYINYSVNGTNYALTGPADKFYGNLNPQGAPPNIYIVGNTGSTGNGSNTASIYIDASGIGVNSTQNLLGFNTGQISDSVNIVTPILVNITEYGTAGQFIAGNFTGSFTGAPPANKSYAVTCSFRVKRSQ